MSSMGYVLDCYSMPSYFLPSILLIVSGQNDAREGKGETAVFAL